MPSSFILLLQYAIPLLLFFHLLFLLYSHKISSPAGNKNKKNNLPPSPPKLPIIGNLHQFGSLPHRSLQSLSKKYGDIMLLHLGSKPTIVVSSAEAASQVLKTNDLAFCSKPRLSVFTRVLNNGKDIIAAPYGEYWRRMRSICVHKLLNSKRVQSFRRIREEEVALMVDNIKTMVSSSPTSSAMINMSNVFLSQTNDLICRVALGRKYRRDSDDVGSRFDVEELVRETSELLGTFAIGDFIPWLAWIDRVNGLTARVEKIVKTYDEFLERVLSDHAAADTGNGKDDHGGEENSSTNDFVDVLLDLQNRGDTTGQMPIDRESIKGLILDMFAAGTQTSATALEWMMTDILRKPRVMENLQQEVREIAKGKEAIDEDDLKSMVYLKALLKETHRLHSVAPLLSPREALQDVKINGYDIAAGTLLFTNAWAIARDPKYWEEPEEFRPERFLNSSAAHDFKMIPFGSGRRGCPGELFSTTNVELAMANLLLKFNWTLPSGVERETLDMKEHLGIITNRMVPLVAVATPSIHA